jgi:hypothetical protein
MDKKYINSFRICDYFLSIYKSIQSDYSFRITSIYRCVIANIVINGAFATNIAAAKSGATVMNPFATLTCW